MTFSCKAVHFKFKVKAIGHLSAEENISHAKILSEFLEQTIEVPANRVLIHFHNLEPHEVGLKGTTIQELRKPSSKN